MKHLKNFLVLILITIFGQGFSQENVFLKRDFWDTKPSIETVKTKIEAGNNPSEANSNNFDGVVYSTLQNAPLETITYLISLKGNDVNKLTHDGRTYIFWAAYKGNYQLVEFLLKNGAKTNITDDKGNTIINFAAGAGQNNTRVYDLLISNNSDLIKKTNPNGANALLLTAPTDTDFAMTTYFQSQGLDIHSVDNEGNGIFNYVAKTGNVELMNALLKKGIKGTDQAFLFAATGTRGKTNGLEVYKYLESVGLNPNISNKEGVNPLHILASRSKDEAIINYLLEKGLDVSTKDFNGNNAVMNAASRNGLSIVKLLTENLKEYNATNKKGQSALTLAIRGNKAEVVEYLIKKGYDTSIVDTGGNNLGYYLVNSYSERNKEEFSKKMKLLQENKFDLSAVQKNGNTWYHLAVEKNSLDLLKFALTMDLDIDAKNNEGNTALHLATMKAKDDIVLKFLIKNGADTTIQTDFEETAYDLAKENELLKKNNISFEFLK